VTEQERREAFKAWILNHWSKLDEKVGHRTTQQEFADYIGITRSALALYLTGKRLPEGDNLRIMAMRLGRDIYDILDAPRELPDLALEASAALDEIRRTIEKSGVSLDSPEAEQITIEIMERYGFKHTSTINGDS
jgi:transcriptional regulator with XRE-family HTH domain